MYLFNVAPPVVGVRITRDDVHPSSSVMEGSQKGVIF